MQKRQVDVRFNAAQLKAYPLLFDENGQPRRGVSLHFGWGRGVGKSFFRRQIWWLLVALFDGKVRRDALKPFRGVRIRCLAPTLKQWKLNNWDGILEELSPTGTWGWLGAKLDTQSGQIRFPGGSSITPFPASNYNARTARGMRTDVLDADELDDIDAGVYDAIAVPWLSEPWSLRMELLCGTPTRGRHGLWWRCRQAGQLGEKLRSGALTPEQALALPEVAPIAERFEDDADAAQIIEALESSYTLHATYRDVPDTVSARAVAKARANTVPATFEREWEANPDAGEGLVYAEFDEAFHVREPPPELRFREYHVGNDHGFVDPGVMILFGVFGHGDDAVIWALEEIYEPGIQPTEWDARAKAWGTATFWPDPSRPDRIAALRSMGIAVGVADGPVNKILPGIARVSDMLHPRLIEGSDERHCRLYVSPKCRNFIREFGVYRRKKLADGTFDEEPQDKDNHCLVAGTLVATKRGDLAIETIRPGEQVMTRAGWREVQWAGRTFESAPIWRLDTTFGSLEGTADHPIWTENKGWVRLDAIRYGDILTVWESTDRASESDTTESCFGDIQDLPIESSEFTSPAKMADAFIASCGKRKEVRFQTDITFTTSTKTHSTTNSATSNACQSSITSLGTALQNLSNVAENGSIPFGHLRPPGIEAKLVELGIARTVSALWQRESGSPESAISAAPNLPHGLHRIGSARTIANRRGDVEQEWMTKRGVASSADRHFEPTNIPRKRLARGIALESRCVNRSEAVYDLTVRDDHEFFANGILVHNSMDAARYFCYGRFGAAPNYRTEIRG